MEVCDEEPKEQYVQRRRGATASGRGASEFQLTAKANVTSGQVAMGAKPYRLWTPEHLAGQRQLCCNDVWMTTLAASTPIPTPPRRAVARRRLDSAAHSSVQ